MSPGRGSLIPTVCAASPPPPGHCPAGPARGTMTREAGSRLLRGVWRPQVRARSAESQSPHVAPASLPVLVGHSPCVCWGHLLLMAAQLAWGLLSANKSLRSCLSQVSGSRRPQAPRLLAAPHCHPSPAVLAGGSLVPPPGFCFREPQTLARALPPPAHTIVTTLTCSGPGMLDTPGSGGGWCEPQGECGKQVPGTRKGRALTPALHGQVGQASCVPGSVGLGWVQGQEALRGAG